MMLSIKKAMEKGNGEVSIRGWVHRERGSNKMKFVVLRDSSSRIQCLFEKSNFSEDEWKNLDKLQVETSIELTGKELLLVMRFMLYHLK
jgi:aspartyl/asparaginyl-tRNA synthetase